MDSASASQAEEDSSILFIRSKEKRARNEKVLRMVNIKFYFNKNDVTAW